MGSYGWKATGAPFGQVGFNSLLQQQQPQQQQQQQQQSSQQQQQQQSAMLACAACRVQKVRSDFSPNQQSKGAARRCRQCVNGGAQGTTTSDFLAQPANQPFAWNPQLNPKQQQQQAKPAGTKPVAQPFAWNPQAQQQQQASTQPFAWNPQLNPKQQQQQAKPAGTKPVAKPFAWNQAQQQQQQAQPASTKPVAQLFAWNQAQHQQQQAQPASTKPVAQLFAWNQAQHQQQQAQPAGTKPVAQLFAWNPQAQHQQQQAQPAGTQPTTGATGVTWTFQQTAAAQQAKGQQAQPGVMPASPQQQPQGQKPAWSFTTGVSSPPTLAPTSPVNPSGAKTGTTAGTDTSSGLSSGPVHNGVGCDLCGVAPITGPRYKCLCCPNFDACGSCIAKDPLGTSWAPNDRGCKHDVLVRVCEPRWMAIGAEVLQNQSNWAHPGFSCSGCGVKTIVGRRYTCTVCDNTHFCERCDFCGVHAAAGLEPHPMLRVNPTVPQGTTAASAATPPTTSVVAIERGRCGGVVPSPTCFCCGWPEQEAAARGHKKKSQ